MRKLETDNAELDTWFAQQELHETGVAFQDARASQHIPQKRQLRGQLKQGKLSH